MMTDLNKQLQLQNIELENQVNFQKQRADNAQQAYRNWRASGAYILFQLSGGRCVMFK